MTRAKATAPQAHADQDATTQATMRREHAGKWLAWTEDESRIIAVGDTPGEVHAAAECSGQAHFILDWVPATGDRQAGGVRE